MSIAINPSFSSLFGFLGKVSLPISTLFFGLLLDNFAKFEPETVIQPPETLLRLRLILAVCPLIPFLLAFLMAYLYPIREERVREARRLIEDRRAHRQCDSDESFDADNSDHDSQGR